MKLKILQENNVHVHKSRDENKTAITLTCTLYTVQKHV